MGAGWRRYASDLGLVKTTIFLQRGLDRQTADLPRRAKNFVALDALYAFQSGAG
jgi:hypothetical protein